MARAIDGELLELEIANIANKLAKSDAQKALMGRVMYCVEHMPTLTPQNEPLTWNELGNMMEKPVYIVELEDGESSLEETFAGYEAGMKLVRSLSSQIDKVEKQIQILSEGEDNE